MKIKRDKYDKKLYLHFGKENFVTFVNDWGQIFGKWNWYSFHFVHIYFESDCMIGGYEFEFVILGVGFRMRINTEKSRKWFKERIKEIKMIKKQKNKK